jgi:type II secretory pathway predicted ATPase ExeA
MRAGALSTPGERAADQRIAAELGSLGAGWTVLRRIQDAQSSTQTRLVIGTSGVYLVTSTCVTGCSVWADDYAFIVDGTRTALVRDARVNAHRIATLLGTRVTPIIVVDAIDLTLGMAHSAVVVLRSDELARWLARRARTTTTPAPHLVARVLRDFAPV